MVSDIAWPLAMVLCFGTLVWCFREWLKMLRTGADITDRLDKHVVDTRTRILDLGNALSKLLAENEELARKHANLLSAHEQLVVRVAGAIEQQKADVVMLGNKWIAELETVKTGQTAQFVQNPRNLGIRRS